jgi:hypothetical protein
LDTDLVEDLVEDLPPGQLSTPRTVDLRVAAVGRGAGPQAPSQPAQASGSGSGPGSRNGDLTEDRTPGDGAGLIKEKPYDVTRPREIMRGVIAAALIFLLAVTVIGPWAAMAWKWMTIDELEKMLCALIAPVVGLVGAVTGFYFGEKSSSV